MRLLFVIYLSLVFALTVSCTDETQMQPEISSDLNIDLDQRTDLDLLVVGDLKQIEFKRSGNELICQDCSLEGINTQVWSAYQILDEGSYLIWNNKNETDLVWPAYDHTFDLELKENKFQIKPWNP